MLYLSGAIRQFGRVDKGASFLDNESLERRRGITIFSKQARFTFGNTSFVLIDTPGHSDFSAETERSLQILDCCVLVISAKDGIKGQTKTLWRLLEEYQVPVYIFVNKMDQDGADRAALSVALKELTGDRTVDFHPDRSALMGSHASGSAAGRQPFRGSSLAETSFFSAEDSSLSDDTFEEIALCSEDAMEEFLQTGRLSDETIQDLIFMRKLFPCFFGSALLMDGVSNLLTALDKYTPEFTYPSDFSARVYKISRADDGARLTFLKVSGGCLKNRMLLPDGEEESKINQIRLYSGDKYETAEMVSAGEICAVTGLKESFAGQGFGNDENEILPLLAPVLSYRALPSGPMDPVKALPYFRIIEEESPELSVTWEETKKEIYVNVMGAIQLEVLTSILKERFDMDVTFDSGEVVYRETIAKPVVGVGHFEPLRHYAEVHLLMEPLERGSGLVFASAVSSDRLAKNWQRLILTHLAERNHKGVLTGSFITDMQITVTAGKAHLKHTEGGDFRQAVYRAVRQGLMMTENVLLEPFYRFTLELPTENVGKALTDLDRIHAEFQAPQPDLETGLSVIIGRGPVAALKDYPAELAAYTKGIGTISFTSDGYGTCHNAEEVILKKGYDPERDVRNPSGSVFCYNGSGQVIPYDEVYAHMHLSFDGSDKHADDSQPGASRRVSDRPLGTEEINAIIASISHANTAKKGPGSNWKKKYGSKSAVVKTFGAGKNSKGADGTTAAGKATAGSSKITAAAFPLEDADYLLADGYNILYAWEDLAALAKENIDSARDALIDILSKYSSMVHTEVIAVFDAYRVKGHAQEYASLQDIRVVYTKEDQTADQYIERFANEHASKKKVAVITSDYTEQIVASAQGCKLVSSREFKRRFDDMSNQLNQKYNIKQNGSQ